MALSFQAFNTPIPEKIKEQLLLKLRIENIRRIKIISLIGFFFFFLFFILDYFRYASGKIAYGNIYFFLFLNHLFFLFFLLPLLFIQSKKRKIVAGDWPYTKNLIYAWTVYVGILLITMASLSLVERGSLSMYTLYMIIANFGVLMLHKDRLILNVASLFIMLVVCILVNHHNPEILTLHILELISITLTCFIVSNQLFNAFVKERHNEYLLEEKSIFLEQQKQKIEALDLSKSALYTNITHEFRTPLTVILGMASKMPRYFKDRNSFRNQEALSLIERNGAQLLNLINQLLDLSKLESKAMPLELEQGDIVAYIKYLFESFHSYADSKNIRLHFSREKAAIVMDFDRNIIQKIISNLIANAIKFTPNEGIINLHIGTQEDNYLQITIQDSGIGIAEEKLPFIFNRFYQAHSISEQSEIGTGIGLALTKELVTLLNGTIEVSSLLKEGSIFKVTLPMTRNALPSTTPLSVKKKGMEWMYPSATESLSAIPTAKVTSTDQAQLLIVEDNADVQTYLKSCLEEQYQLLFAKDGQEGIEIAFEQIPDIIISDVMMPRKDGLELCDTLKKDTRTSHIPIILLTAKASVDNRIEGLQKGADAYLAKPFQPEELAIRLEKLLELRRTLQARYASTDTVVPDTNPAFQLEDEFVIQIRTLVLENLDNPAFNTEALAKSLFLSRQQVHRKLTALTNLSASHFIRSIRLQEAKKLIQTTDKSITEIAFDVGFKEVSYFSRSFAENFGHPPSFLRK